MEEGQKIRNVKNGGGAENKKNVKNGGGGGGRKYIQLVNI